MQTKITARHGQLTDETRAFMTQKCEKLLHLFERVTEIHTLVDFEHAGDRVRVELLVDAEHKHDFTACVEGDDVTHAFEAALHKMEKQVRRYKKRIQNHHGDPPAREIAVDPFADTPPVADEAVFDDSSADVPAVA